MLKLHNTYTKTLRIRFLVAAMIIGNLTISCTLINNHESATPPNLVSIQNTSTPDVDQPPTVENSPPPDELNGSLALTCSHGIYKLDFVNGGFTPLVINDSQLFSNLGIVDNWVYFLRTTELKETNSPAGGQFGLNDIFRVQTNGSNLERLIQDDNSDFNLVAIPKTRKLLFVSDRIDLDHSPNRYKLVLWNIDDKSELIIAESYNHFLPVPSPTSENIAVLELPISSSDKPILSLFDVHSNVMVKMIADKDILLAKPSWSPDGEYIVLATKEGNQININLINIETQANDIFVWTNDEPKNFSWSPDGKKILIETNIDPRSVNPSAKLWLVNVSDKTEKLLYEGGVLTGIGNDTYSIWSPDNKYIIFFTETQDGKQSIKTQNLETLEMNDTELPCFFKGSADWILENP